MAQRKTYSVVNVMDAVRAYQVAKNELMEMMRIQVELEKQTSESYLKAGVKGMEVAQLRKEMLTVLDDGEVL